MGSKSEAKTLMEQAGVPLLPGYHGAGQEPEMLRRAAAGIGYPVMLKASAGGGGKGMRRVADEAEFDAARSEEHTSELQSLMRISYAVFCLKKKKATRTN